MNKKILYGLGILFVISLSFFIFGSLYENEMPKIVEEINNSSIGAILTAIITVLLLSQQSSSEEIKERNVRVFEEKSEKYNVFIEKLWEVWDDRVVSLEEIHQIIKMLSKDIVLYTKPETVEKIADCLMEIAKQAKPDKTDSNDENVTQLIQKNILTIINALAKELGLGGEINDVIRTKINALEEMVLPYLLMKDFTKLFLQSFEATIKAAEEHDLTEVEYKKGFIWCQVKNSSVKIRIGPMERALGANGYIVAFVEFFSNRSYTPYREAARGWRKDFLQGTRVHETYDKLIVNFKSLEHAKKYAPILGDMENLETNELAKAVIAESKKWKISGKTLSEVVDLCEKTN
jgi:hypothetical protein